MFQTIECECIKEFNIFLIPQYLQPYILSSRNTRDLGITMPFDHAHRKCNCSNAQIAIAIIKTGTEAQSILT
ncbi:MAG: hypothetical protein KME55_40200 [Nostoc indistinguendum CM1-VF10]|nr:hypothetical protein [Nostoc indistinguendum CM1-VF10]